MSICRSEYTVGRVIEGSRRHVPMIRVTLTPARDSWDAVAEDYLERYGGDLPAAGLLGLIITNEDTAFVPLEPFVPEPTPRYRVKR